ncbi:hypothetical protein MPTK1_4g17450 [Marchantia polymorpha subsp. ruderalis]|uniref:Uncharacterized protein n=2 Tax=Marchantia polymorpha TaxID=3197 RepID=A0AAF6BAV3_MARPO|nr:hypothetical protein MARPO_0041s0027 [Marchantia polymorpha]BBN09137.1 hypothetical protein Mp_4g17450 [Marchantia polymorpha subsp. ruderalis]|eukprot:PTQ40125.1 hypothetical protein MARPO_0041s0027 [Marchantia polymorpha]
MRLDAVLVVVLTLGLTVDAAFADNSLSGSPDGQVCKKSSLKRADGKQNLQSDQGTCSTTQLGEIPSRDHMTSTLILEPQSGATIPARTAFQVIVKMMNLDTGFFSDPETQYYTSSQQLNKDGLIKGHAHIVVQKLRGRDLVPSATDFDFFKGLNTAADGDERLFASVDEGLSPGKYRLCSTAASFSHNSLVLPVAQRGPQDDCIRFTVK